MCGSGSLTIVLPRVAGLAEGIRWVVRADRPADGVHVRLDVMHRQHALCRRGLLSATERPSRDVAPHRFAHLPQPSPETAGTPETPRRQRAWTAGGGGSSPPASMGECRTSNSPPLHTLRNLPAHMQTVSDLPAISISTVRRKQAAVVCVGFCSTDWGRNAPPFAREPAPWKRTRSRRRRQVTHQLAARRESVERCSRAVAGVVVEQCTARTARAVLVGRGGDANGHQLAGVR